jgi:predicted ATP-grasp superfamily ATP-dependent carboligase
MRVFVYEHITGGGLLLGDGDLAPLAREGDMMIRALLRDLAEIPGVEPVVLRDARLEPDLPATVLVPRAASDFWPSFERALQMSDAVWPIAPEQEGWLERITQVVLDSGRTLLNSRARAVRLTGSKLATSRALAAAAVPVVKTYARAEQVPPDAAAFVAKPDDGAGCVDTYVVRDHNGLGRRELGHSAQGQVYQPLVVGEPRSLCVLCCEGHARLMCCNRQHIVEEDGKLGFAGVTVNALGDADGSYARLAQAVAAAIPGLWGHVGIDFIEAPSGPVVIEVNPRMTTACIGLRTALAINLGALVLGLPDSLRDLTIARPGSGRAVHVQVLHPDATEYSPSPLAGEGRGEGS